MINAGRIFTKIRNLFRSKGNRVNPGKEKQIGGSILNFAHKWHAKYELPSETTERHSACLTWS